MQTVRLISIGAVIGANLRYFVVRYLARFNHPSLSIATLAINISPSFFLAFFLTWTSSASLRTLVGAHLSLSASAPRTRHTRARHSRRLSFSRRATSRSPLSMWS